MRKLFIPVVSSLLLVTCGHSPFLVLGCPLPPACPATEAVVQ